jgi:molybdenum cofactor cytidylyltransferase
VILEELAAVVLAAGRSRRMGRPKALLSIDGEPLLARTHRLLRSYGIARVLTVLGDEAPAIRARLALDPRDVVVNPAVERGPFSSLLLALERLVREDDSVPGVFVLPVDVPAPPRAVWDALATQAESPDTLAAVPTYAGRGGHPLLLTPEGAHAVRGSLEAHRLDALLHAWGSERVRRVPVGDPGVCVNLNAPADVRRYRPGAWAADSRN